MCNITEEKLGPHLRKKGLRLFTLTNRQGTEIQVCNLGARIVSIKVPDKQGRVEDITLGFDNIADYIHDTHYLGCVVGPYANRIARGQFKLGDNRYQLDLNDGNHHLHGGSTGLHKKSWSAAIIRPQDNHRAQTLVLKSKSLDGEGGYPGNVDIEVQYSLNGKNQLCIGYRAVSDRETVINLSHHAYFNLAATGCSHILDHSLQIHAEQISAIDSELIPTGEIKSVKGSPFDFRTPKEIGASIDDDDPQLTMAGGYDHNWVLNSGLASEVRFAAAVTEPISGRSLKVYTDQPGIQFYSGNRIEAGLPGKAGLVYSPRSGFCLETQHFPDSPNHAHFPSTRLAAGEFFESQTNYEFGV